jgi:hypothetical protein
VQPAAVVATDKAKNGQLGSRGGLGATVGRTYPSGACVDFIDAPLRRLDIWRLGHSKNGEVKDVGRGSEGHCARR